MLPSTSNVALKEWAVTVEALEQGRQILLLRKGGIREERREFRVLLPQFLLYPTYEHQQEDMLKGPHRADLRPSLARDPDPEHVAFTHWARVEEVMELSDEADVSRLSPYHVWTEDYAQKRLHWKPRKPLSLMLLRVYRLWEPQKLPYLSEYGGCKSWVHLGREVPLGRLSPVMPDQAFRSAMSKIKDALFLFPVQSQ